jgi:hypothetical protein
VLDDRSPISPAPKTARRYLPVGYDTSKWPDDPAQGHKNRPIPTSAFGYVVGLLYILFGSTLVITDFVALTSGRLYIFARTGGWWSSLTQDNLWWWFFWLMYLIVGAALVVQGIRNFRPIRTNRKPT